MRWVHNSGDLGGRAQVELLEPTDHGHAALVLEARVGDLNARAHLVQRLLEHVAELLRHLLHLVLQLLDLAALGRDHAVLLALYLLEVHAREFC